MSENHHVVIVPHGLSIAFFKFCCFCALFTETVCVSESLKTPLHNISIYTIILKHASPESPALPTVGPTYTYIHTSSSSISLHLSFNFTVLRIFPMHYPFHSTSHALQLHFMHYSLRLINISVTYTYA